MKRILVVGGRLLKPRFRLFLEAKGYQLIRGDRLRDAVASFLEDPPDLLVVEKGFDNGREIELINAAKACLQKANIPILLVATRAEIARGLDWELYRVDDLIAQPFSPEMLFAHLRLAEARMHRVFDNNPLSRLPGNTSILRAIQRALEEEQTSGICYLDIDNFKPYNDLYGFYRGDEVILTVARIAVNVIEELAPADSFVGHIGGDDFVFIVRSEKIKIICDKILSNFEQVKNMFLNHDDIKAGCLTATDRQGRKTTFPLLSISIAVILSGPGKFEHSGQLSLAAAQLKTYVKKMAGSNYVIDRRENLQQLPAETFAN